MIIYIKDLTPEEIIKRLKNGEVVKIENDKGYFEMIDGLICYYYSDGDVGIGAELYKSYYNAYFETEEPFEIKETGLYKTRDGRKAFVSKIYDVYALGLIMDGEEFVEWRIDGFIFDDKREDNQDLISKWED